MRMYVCMRQSVCVYVRVHLCVVMVKACGEFKSKDCKFTMGWHGAVQSEYECVGL